MFADKKILVLDASGTSSVEKAPAGSVGPIDVSVHYHLKTLKTYDKDVYDPDNALVFGCGPFAGAKIGGVYRATFFARSPIWKGLYSSNMGGAGIALYGSGFDFFLLKGKASLKTIISVSNVDGKPKIEFLEISDKKLSSVYSGYKGFKGTYALERFAFDSFKDRYSNGGGFVAVRSLAVGPAALVTDYCGILSTFINSDGKFEVGREDWAGRGGFGSLMAQGHNVVAIVIGGDCDDRTFNPDLKDMSVVNKLFEDELGASAGRAISDATEKYRYVEKIGSGGTFGVNFSTLGSSVLSYNWSSVGFSVAKRKKIYDDLVKEKYLFDFNERVIKTKSWKTCGEICAAMCKKIDGKSKIDYEPYEANGPNCGIFDLRKVEKVVGLADEMGFDAIHIGTIISFVLEAKAKGLLTDAEIAGDFGDEKAALEIMKLIVSGVGIGKYFKHGLRSGSKELDKAYPSKGIGFNDIAVYVANGPDGEIAPNQYWVPGFFLPLPIQGKFLTYYGSDFLKPLKLGEKGALRFILELQTDNLGICRFHRGWSEKIKDVLLEAALGIKHDREKHIRSVIKDIVKYDVLAGAVPVSAEALKVKEIIYTYLKDTYRKFPEEVGILPILESFDKDLGKGCSNYFKLSKKGICKVLGVDF